MDKLYIYKTTMCGDKHTTLPFPREKKDKIIHQDPRTEFITTTRILMSKIV
jgi:hypothetical protein